MNALRTLTVLLSAPALSAQVFEVASVRLNPAGSPGGEGATRQSISYNPGSLTMRNVTLKNCVEWAYSVAGYQVTGPGWIGQQRYDIVAKTGTAATPGQLRVMLQALLASRFELSLHREVRQLPLYELVVGKGGPKLSAAAEDGEAKMRPGEGDLVFRSYSMAELADALPGIPFRVDRTVVDKTGLAGKYDFRLRIAGNAADMKRGFEHGDGPLASDVVQQIGLRLEAHKGPIELLVIDKAEKLPADTHAKSAPRLRTPRANTSFQG